MGKKEDQKECKINEFITVKLEDVELERWLEGPGGKDYRAGYYTELRTNIYINGELWIDYYEEVSRDLHDPNTYEELCRDLRRWYTSDYDCSLLSSDLAFCLLKMLIESEDPLAIKVGDQEILRGLREGKIEEDYRTLLSRETYWENVDFEMIKIIQDLENLNAFLSVNFINMLLKNVIFSFYYHNDYNKHLLCQYF